MQGKGSEAELHQHKDKRKQQTMQQHHEGSNTIPYKSKNQIPLH
jgi:hypothetical protein